MHSAMKSKNNEKIGINEFPRKGDKKYNRESFCLSVCVCVFVNEIYEEWDIHMSILTLKLVQYIFNKKKINIVIIALEKVNERKLNLVRLVCTYEKK